MTRVYQALPLHLLQKFYPEIYYQVLHEVRLSTKNKSKIILLLLSIVSHHPSSFAASNHHHKFN